MRGKAKGGFRFLESWPSRRCACAPKYLPIVLKVSSVLREEKSCTWGVRGREEKEKGRGGEIGGKREKGKREREKESKRDTQEPPFLGRLSLSEFPRLAISEKPP